MNANVWCFGNFSTNNLLKQLEGRCIQVKMRNRPSESVMLIVFAAGCLLCFLVGYLQSDILVEEVALMSTPECSCSERER